MRVPVVEYFYYCDSNKKFVNKDVLLLCFHHLEFFALLTDPPSKSIDETSVDLFRDLLNLNLVNYFLFCKVSTVFLF